MLVLAALLLTGCGLITKSGAIEPGLIQQVLTAVLAPDHVGPASFSHKNGYFKITIRAGNVRKGASGAWVWDWLIYSRDGFVSSGSIITGTPPRELINP